jgi:lipopolysaccharide export system protein LptA
MSIDSASYQKPPVWMACGLLLVLLASSSAHADRADRDKPVTLEADRVTVDEAKKLHIFEGNVALGQGTLSIRSSRLVVTQDADGFQKGVATGGPARFKQRREGRDDYVEGEADRIEHDNRSERTEFFGNARIKSGLDEVRGNYIAYDARTEQYSAGGGTSGSAKAEGGGRVRAVIQPRQKSTTEPAPSGGQKN